MDGVSAAHFTPDPRPKKASSSDMACAVRRPQPDDTVDLGRLLDLGAISLPSTPPGTPRCHMPYNASAMSLSASTAALSSPRSSGLSPRGSGRGMRAAASSIAPCCGIDCSCRDCRLVRWAAAIAGPDDGRRKAAAAPLDDIAGGSSGNLHGRCALRRKGSDGLKLRPVSTTITYLSEDGTGLPLTVSQDEGATTDGVHRSEVVFGELRARLTQHGRHAAPPGIARLVVSAVQNGNEEVIYRLLRSPGGGPRSVCGDESAVRALLTATARIYNSDGPGLIAAVRAHAADGHAGGAAALLAELAALAADADAPRYERHYV